MTKNKNSDNVPKKGHDDKDSEAWLPVIIHEPARKEVLTWPSSAKKEFGSILTRLQKGHSTGPSETKPMKTVAPGVFEIRISDEDSHFRAFYLIKTVWGIVVFHSFKKKTSQTPNREIQLGKRRLKAALKELADET